MVVVVGSRFDTCLPCRVRQIDTGQARPASSSTGALAPRTESHDSHSPTPPTHASARTNASTTSTVMADSAASGGGGAGGSADDVMSMPVRDRLASKLWKARLSAYEEMAKTFERTPSEDDPIFDEYARDADLLRDMALDSNAAAQEKGVEALCSFVRYGGIQAGRYVVFICKFPSYRTGLEKL